MDKALMAALFAPAAPVSPEEAELRDWLKRCAPILEDRTPDEIAHLAILGGFDRLLVYAVMPSYAMDALSRTDIHQRAAFQTYQLEIAIEDFNKQKDALKYVAELDLRPLWEDVIMYQTGEVVTLKKGA